MNVGINTPTDVCLNVSEVFMFPVHNVAEMHDMVLNLKIEDTLFDQSSFPKSSGGGVKGRSQFKLC